MSKRSFQDQGNVFCCALGNDKCNTCRRCLKRNAGLKVVEANIVEASESFNSDDVIPEDPVNNKSKSATIDLSESSSSSSKPLPDISTAQKENYAFYNKIMDVFPDICPDYLRNLCNGLEQSMDYVISHLLEGNYERRKQELGPVPTIQIDEQYKTLLEVFPNADPTYLHQHCERLFKQPQEFIDFFANLLENKNYPTKDKYLKKLKLCAQQKQYTTEFDVQKFLEEIPNPEAFFKNRSIQRNPIDEDFALNFLKTQYNHLTVKVINKVLTNCGQNVVEASLELEKLGLSSKSKKGIFSLEGCENISLLQEIAYIEHKNEIINYMKKKEEEKCMNREFAKNAALLKSCECCYDEEVMPEEIACCEYGHVFCKECVQKSCEVKIGEGKFDLSCLTICEAKFSLQVLQTVLAPKLFSKMAQKKQIEEVLLAGIEELEFCPFCDFATIPATDDKLFRCLNSDCMKESCRKCKELSHIPYRCDQIEKENDVKLRTYIEDKMTEALVRKCYKCGMKFVKDEGCNKMTCSCGAMMCYVCKKPVQDYKHFNGLGGDQYHLCPLYNDIHKFHMEAVEQGAENAKKELGITGNQLKIDPTENLEEHYKMLANIYPQEWN